VRKAVGVVVMVASIALITIMLVAVILGKTGVLSRNAIVVYVLHPLTMILAMWLIGRKKRGGAVEREEHRRTA
jgi:hypothetical protein